MASIVDEIRNDPEKGAKLLESEYKAGLMSLARRFCTDESDAESLVNRTFAIVVDKIDSYLEQSAFFGWMSRILVNCHSKDVRRKSNEMEFCDADIPEDAPDDDASARVFREVDASILRDAIDRLPKNMKQTLLMHYFMDMPVREVAKVLSVPSGTIMWRLHYARQILAAKLGAKIKKPAVVLIVAALFLVASAAIMVNGVLGGNAAGEDEARAAETTEAPGTAETPKTTATAGSLSLVPDVSMVPDVPEYFSQSTQQGETTMTRKKAAAAALSAAIAVGPLAAANGDEYQFIISGDPVAAATEGSSSASSGTCALTGGPLADGTVFASSLEGRYRTMDDSPARKLRSDKFKSVIISFK